MERGCLGLVAAMPQEIAPLLQALGRQKPEKVQGFKLYRFDFEGVPVALVESGMGPRHAAAATELLISQAAPKAILNFGFAGAVLPGLRVGELVLSERVFLLESGELQEIAEWDPSLYYLLLQRLNAALIPLRRGAFITAAAIMNKKEVAEKVAERFSHPVLEMETAAVLQTAARAGVPAAALRAISDAAEEELGFSLEEFCDGDLNLSLPRILFSVARKPGIMPQLIRLSKNSKAAGANLAIAVEAAMRGIIKEGIF
jgi:adenosylhomocysteine nucleosidase